MIVVLEKDTAATDEDIQKASEEYKTYVKVTIDVQQGLVAIGGEYHYDAEQELLKLGSNQEDVWGGGIDLITKKIDTNAIINIRPQRNYSTEICDEYVRQKFFTFIKKHLKNYAQQ